MLRGLGGPVLEVGCGPGRLVAALTEAGTVALGLDTSPLALELAARRGAATHNGSIFEPVPDEGRWATALLVGGGVGIGGDPVALLRRVREVLRPRGVVLVEARPPGAVVTRGVAAIEHDHGRFETIAWAELGIDQLDHAAARAGYAVEHRRQIDTRWFAWLRSRRAA